MIPFGGNADSAYWALQDFAARSGCEGPQAICTWTPPTGSIDRLRIRRKRGEYPRDENDGVLLLDTVEDLAATSALVDTASDLLETTDSHGGAWWYYRAFVIPSAIAAEDRFCGRGKQTVAGGGNTLPIDVQAFATVRVKLRNSSFVAAQATIQTAPALDGPWADLSVPAIALPVGTSAEVAFADAAMKYLRVQVTGPLSIVAVWVLAPWPQVWQSAPGMRAATLVFQTGRMTRLIHQFCLPHIYRTLDAQQSQTRLIESEVAADGELASLDQTGEDLGPFERFLRVFAAELDRIFAYMSEVRDHHTDTKEAPEGLLRLLAFELGWSVDLERHLNALRHEIDSLPSIWKRKGTSFIVGRLASQNLGFVPRVQEGAGLLLRILDPDQLQRG